MLNCFASPDVLARGPVPMEPYAASSTLPSRRTERHLLIPVAQHLCFSSNKDRNSSHYASGFTGVTCSIHSIGTSSRLWRGAACSHTNPCGFHLRLAGPGVIPVYCGMLTKPCEHFPQRGNRLNLSLLFPVRHVLAPSFFF